MVRLSELKEKLDLTVVNAPAEDREVQDGYVCDLLSWVMAKGTEGMAWITVQTHLNVLAVAVLHDFACVIVPEGIAISPETVKKAEEEQIALYSAKATAYELCTKMARLGIGAK